VFVNAHRLDSDQYRHLQQRRALLLINILLVCDTSRSRPSLIFRFVQSEHRF